MLPPKSKIFFNGLDNVNRRMLPAHVPRSSVEYVKVGVSHWRPECLVREVGRSPRERRQPPLEVAVRGVPPRACVAVERALGRHLSAVRREG